MPWKIRWRHRRCLPDTSGTRRCWCPLGGYRWPRCAYGCTPSRPPSPLRPTAPGRLRPYPVRGIQHSRDCYLANVGSAPGLFGPICPPRTRGCGEYWRGVTWPRRRPRPLPAWSWSRRLLPWRCHPWSKQARIPPTLWPRANRGKWPRERP